MSQYRKGNHVRNQPQFDILSPLYSNPPVWSGAEFVRGYNGRETKEISRAALEGLVGGDTMLADGNIIRRFVWVHKCMAWAAYGFLVSHDYRMPSVECHENCGTIDELNVARHAFSCSMRFGPIWFDWCSCIRIMPSSYQILRCFCFIRRQVFQHGHRMGWVSLAPSFWSLFSIDSLCYCDVSHHSHGWRSICIGVCEKGLLWWDVAIFVP